MYLQNVIQSNCDCQRSDVLQDSGCLSDQCPIEKQIILRILRQLTEGRKEGNISFNDALNTF